MQKPLLFLAALLLSLAPRSSHALGADFGGEYRHPDAFLRSFPAPAQRAMEPVVRSSVLIGQRATGFLIHPDGWMITAAHAIRDLVIGPTTECSRIPLWLHHEVDAYGATDRYLVRLRCEQVKIYETGDDFALLKVRPLKEADLSRSWARLATDETAIQIGDRVHTVGHPNARDYSKAVRQVTSGELVLRDPKNEELPHFLHLADTQGGNSGGPVFNERGEVIGLHIRGVTNFSEGVDAVVGGQPKKIRDFNIAVWMPHLVKKYRLDQLN